MTGYGFSVTERVTLLVKQFNPCNLTQEKNKYSDARSKCDTFEPGHK